jgi:predicted site-specific integrase-resolvase
MNGYPIHGVFSDIVSGGFFEKRREFFQLLDDILDYKVEKIILTFKDRLSRVGFGLFTHLFQKYGTEIVVISELGSSKLDVEEVSEEIVSLLHCYSMKLYSKQRKQILEVRLVPNSS